MEAIRLTPLAADHGNGDADLPRRTAKRIAYSTQTGDTPGFLDNVLELGSASMLRSIKHSVCYAALPWSLGVGFGNDGPSPTIGIGSGVSTWPQ